MKLGSIGEFGLIERFAPLFLKNLPEGMLGIGDDCAVIPLSAGHDAPLFLKNLPEGMPGIGDDCAVIPLSAGQSRRGEDDSPAGESRIAEKGGIPEKDKAAEGECLLVTTDLLIENIHFLRERITPEDLGYKSLSVNLSDIAGMGGAPLFAFLSIGLPGDIEIEWTDRFFKGFNSLAEETGTFLMGGDTTASDKGIVINVTVIGKSDLSRVKYRTGADPGDFICISGMTGESAAGLKIVLDSSLESAAGRKLADRLIESHNRPRPHIDEGLFLSSEKGVHAMMDISDGIDSDLRHIMKKSSVSAEIDLEAVPLSSSLSDAQKAFGIDPYPAALADGEDYCLLLTVDSDFYEDVNRRYKERFGKPLYRIGRITAAQSSVHRAAFPSGLTDSGQECKPVYLKNGKPVELAERGFDHFLS